MAGLEIAKSVDRATTFPGDTVTYQVIVANTGPTTLPAASFVDDLTNVIDQAQLISSGADVGTVTFTTPLLHWTGSLAPGAQATVTYAVRVAAGTEGGHLRNAVTSTVPGASCPGGTSCVTDTPIAGLNVTKSVDQTVTAPGDTVNYTVVVTNTGASAQSGTLFTDDLTGVLAGADFITGSTTTGAVTFTSPLLTLTGTLAPTEAATVSYSVRVHAAGSVGSHHLVNSITSTAPGAQCPVCTTDTPVAELTLHKSASPTVVAPGDLVTYTVVVTNDGATTYTPASFVDDLTQPLVSADFDSASASVGTVQFTAPLLSWSGPLAPGESATVTYSVRVARLGRPRHAAGQHRAIGPARQQLPGALGDRRRRLGGTGDAAGATLAPGTGGGSGRLQHHGDGEPGYRQPLGHHPEHAAADHGTAHHRTPDYRAIEHASGNAARHAGDRAAGGDVSARGGRPRRRPRGIPLTGASVLRLVVLGLVLVAGSLVLLMARRRRPGR